MRKHLANILIGVVFLCGVGLLAHQRFMCDAGWFDFEQFWHHENLAVICFASSITLVVGQYIYRRK